MNGFQVFFVAVSWIVILETEEWLFNTNFGGLKMHLAVFTGLGGGMIDLTGIIFITPRTTK